MLPLMPIALLFTLLCFKGRVKGVELTIYKGRKAVSFSTQYQAGQTFNHTPKTSTIATYLSQGALNRSQVVVIVKTAGAVVNVIDGEAELLRLLKAIVHLDGGGEIGVQCVLLPFCLPDLKMEISKILMIYFLYNSKEV